MKNFIIYCLFIFIFLSCSKNSNARAQSSSNDSTTQKSDTTVKNVENTEIKYSEYKNLVIGHDKMLELGRNSNDGSKWSVVCDATIKDNNQWRITSGGVYIDINVPNKFIQILDPLKESYLFFINVKLNKDQTRTFTAVDVVPLYDIGIPNYGQGNDYNDIIKNRTWKGFNLEEFLIEYIENKNNTLWINPIKMLPSDPNAKYNDYIRPLPITSLEKAKVGTKGYFIAEVNDTNINRQGVYQWEVGIYRMWMDIPREKEKLLGNNYKNKWFLFLAEITEDTVSKKRKFNIIDVFSDGVTNKPSYEYPNSDREMYWAEYIIKQK